MSPFVVKSAQALRESVGKDIGHTDWFRITQERITQFAEATEDSQWIHVDAARAPVESPYGATIAHGFLTLSLISHFVKEAIQIDSGVRLAVNYGLNRVRFPAAVRAGSRVRASIALLRFEEFTDGVTATYSVTIEVEDFDKPCCVAEWIVRYYC